MGSYQPFLIANLRTGLQLNLEPWLLPKDAFSMLENAYLENGVIVKRNGYSLFADTGTGYPITGIFHYIESDGSKSLLVTDTKRLYEYNTSTKALDDKDGSDYYTGDASSFISSCNWLDKVYMANAKDQCREYNGSTVSTWKVDITGDANNNLDYCRLIMTLKERIILFYTSEDGVLYPQRARWCTASNPDAWNNDEYIDAPTYEHIKGAAYMGDDIIVFFDESVWMLKYTGDSTLPFRWERVSTIAGCASPFSVIEYDKAFALDKLGLVAADEFSVNRIDAKLSRFILEFNPNQADLVYGGLCKELKQMWFLYPSYNATAPDRALIFNYEDWSFSTFIIPLNCLGTYVSQDVVTWESASGSWADYPGKWVEGRGIVGYPLMLGGASNGKVYKLNDTYGDASSNIAMTIDTGRWNPFVKDGRKARLGYIDFLVECNEGYELEIDFFLDFNDTSYQTKTLKFNKSGQKAWVRIFSGAIGNSHQIRIRDNKNDQQPKIHAMIPYFKPAGRLTIELVDIAEYLIMGGDYLSIGGERMKL